MFQAPNKRNNASARYKGFVNAKSNSAKSNSYREHHPDAHYLFARNKQHREFAEQFSNEICWMSMDDMAKVKVGTQAVSHYHQLRRIFGTNNIPNYSDHDFPMLSYLLVVSGYMVLESSNSSTVEHEGLQLATAVLQQNNVPLSKNNLNRMKTILSFQFLKISVRTKSSNDFLKLFSSQLSTHLNNKICEDEIIDVIKI